MAYTGSRRPSVLAALGSWVMPVLAAAVVWWVTFVNLRSEHTFGDLTPHIVAFIGWVIVAIVLHECGHLAMGLALHEPVRKIRIGTGPTLVGFRIGSLTVQLCLLPITGGAVYFSRLGVGRGAHLASLAAGPAVNLVAAVGGYLVWQSGAGWLGAFVLAHVLLFVGSATPSTTTEGGRLSQSDGMQILNLLLRPALPRTNYEGAEMTQDAFAVLARAGEDASLAGADDVTDIDVLRALSRNGAVGPMLRSAGVSGRIPPLAIAESDDLTRPKVSKLLDSAITASVQRCRDMAIYKPSAASFCLGLLLTDCPAGRLMKEAGVTEESVLRLITVPEEEDLRRTTVITADLPLERWGTAADAIVAEASRIAAVDRSPYIGTQHLVAAVVRAPGCRGALALARLRFVLAWKQEDREPDSDQQPEDGVPMLSPQAGLALSGALWRTGATLPTGTAELLLGIVDQSAGIGAQILLSAGIGSRELEKAIRYTPREQSDPCGCTPASRSLWMLRGSARVGAERWLDARADFLAADAASTTDAQHALCSNNIAWVSLMTGDRAYAAEALERSRAALAVKPDQISFQGTNAFALLENGSPAEAAATLEAVIPKHGRPRNRASDLCLLAICRARLGQADIARQLVAEAAAADAKCPLLARARAEATVADVPAAGALSSMHGR